MKLEKFNYSNGKRGRWFLYGFIMAVALMVLINLFFSEAKYLNTESVKIAEGTINYKPYDFKIMAMYQENDNGEYEEIEIMPTSGYIINEEKSYCTLDNVNIDTNAVLKTNDNEEHTFSNISKNDKCYIYFDQYTQIINYTMLYDGSLGDITANQCVEITGGWTNNGYTYKEIPTSGIISTTYGVTYNNAYINFKYNGYITFSGTTYPINLEGYTKMLIHTNSTNGLNYITTGLFAQTTKNIINYESFFADESNFNSKYPFGLQNIENLGGTRYIGLLTGGADFTKSWEINFITIFKKDDISRLTDYGSTITEIMNNSNSLLKDKSAIKYMLRNCTGDFMATAISNDTFMTELKNSPYKDLVYANEHWAKFLSMVE